MLPGRKRRAEPLDDYPDSSPAPAARATQQTQRGGQQTRRQQSPDSDAEDFVDGDEGGESDNASIQQLAKNLVRYALSCEYARVPLRRQDISTKVLGARSRAFKEVFDEAQVMLQDIFGMEMVELEKKEKVTISQKRAAQMSQNASKTSGQWILKNVLPKKYLNDDRILSPPRAPTIEAESQYVGLYSMAVSLILLAGGTLPEAKLDRHLKRLNADQSTPIDKTDKVLARMGKDGYIIKVKENQGGEETIDYVVGPRGKAEVGAEGVAAFVKRVYGEEADDSLHQRLARSLGLSERGAWEAGPATQRRDRGRPRRPDSNEEEQDEDQSEED
ncbi:MAGE-domain-containing protein [Mytilinidion resinicola]|uniref:MAGE-domain-containing protein n=1 Tax=Mytilinidion resinicola TaxID=574789 RepID=A0A6A6Z7G6_9PEZI|nr:MAGE-domain-containing protein [Mytilinidion resinicola]KAF2816980.1 MAGE-domain-containing protein [Mytilinidion resinicola]